MSKRAKSETESDSESEWFRPRKTNKINQESQQNISPVVGQYTCNVCHKNYTHRQTLAVHKKQCTAPKSKNLQCKFCKTKFSYRQSLHRHEKLCKKDSAIKVIHDSCLGRSHNEPKNTESEGAKCSPRNIENEGAKFSPRNTENEGANFSPENTENEGVKFSREKEEIFEEIEREIDDVEEKESNGHRIGETDLKLHKHPYICNNCGVEIRRRPDFIKHLRSCQTKQLDAQKNSHKYTQCYFPDCDSKFYHKISIIKHLNEKHFQNLEVETFQFENEDEFKEFKKERDMEFFMSTVKHCGSSKNKDETVTYEYFHCNFDVQNRKKGKSLIPNTNCPARLLIKKTNNCHYEVKFIKYHTHEIEVENLKYHRYPKECLNYLKTMLSKGVPPRTLQEHLVPHNVHDLFPIKEHFLEVKEIRDLKNRMEKKLHLNPSDADAVALLVEKLHTEEQSITLYKPQGVEKVKYGPQMGYREDASQIFALGYQNSRMRNEFIKGASRIVCIDGTHGTNRYKFILLTMIVPDEYNRGYPVAFLLTNAMDADLLKLFFSSIFDRCPSVKINVLMTDDDTALISAFRDVFGPDFYHILCTWHILRNWKKHLHATVKNTELLDQMYNILVTITEELDTDIFMAMLYQFMYACDNTSECKAFVLYFRENYVNRCEKWAWCCRQFPHCKTNTNNYCESFNSLFKRIYLINRTDTRLEDCLKQIIQLEWGKSLKLRKSRIFKKPLPGSKHVNHQQSHKKGMVIPDEAVTREREDLWHIQSDTREHLLHTVRQFIATCCTDTTSCFVRCTESRCFNLCSHMYVCSCENPFPLCKHVHKVHSMTRRTKSSETTQPFPQDAEETEGWKLHSTPPPSTKPFEIAKASRMVLDCRRIFQKLSDGLDNECVRESLLDHIHGTAQQLESMLDCVMAKSVSFPPLPTMDHEKIAPNQKKEKQPNTLFRTLKKREKTKKSSLPPHPSQAVKFSLKKQLLRVELDADILSESQLGEYVASSWAELQKPLFTVNGEQITMYELKSLDVDLIDQEVEHINVLRTINARGLAQFVKGWTNSAVIDAFLYTLIKNNPTCAYMNNFMTQYFSASDLGKYLDNTVKLRDSFMSNLVPHQGATKIFIPFNPTGGHWTLIYCDVQNRSMYFLNPQKPDFHDPLAQTMEPYNSCLRRWVRILSTVYNDGPWTVLGKDHVQQTDNINCGQYICYFVEHLIDDEEFLLKTSFDPFFYRDKMLRHIIIEGLRQPVIYHDDVWDSADGECPYTVNENGIIVLD